ncbi:major capsid protein [Peribacillus simplex]|uniref:Major capsid protein n=1 Tax=Peribacillus simplex TaxID=1478 RepID=A0A109MXN0_9BACI|nr:phage major capsid protein [Peribacillus simplex]KWW18005.1 major capsid protein [Peribacillus simplex]
MNWFKPVTSLLKLDLQHFGGSTLFELKQNMATLGQQLQKYEGELSQKAIDPTATLEDIKALQKSKEDIKARFDVIKEQHDVLEAEQKARFAENQNIQNLGIAAENDPKQKVIKAKAELIRATIRNQAVSKDVMAVLGDRNNTGGEKLLPTTMSDEILMEPLVKNPLRNISTFTNLMNLEVPKISFTLDDDDFIADTETAKELKVTGDVVKFTRNKFKVFAPVSETVLRGSNVNLVQSVERALESGLAAKEKKIAFAKTPKAGEEHMSFYQTGATAIKTVNGADIYEAVVNALADLHEDYRENAKVVMNYADYTKVVKFLNNGNSTYFAAPPESIWGKGVEFIDAASEPIVGDFSYSHFNYDLDVLYERDKNVRTGIEDFVLTAYVDHQIKLKSAFRIAKVVPQV